MNRMEFLSGEVDLTEWGITETIGVTIGKEMMREISETITEQLKETPPWLDFPYVWHAHRRKGEPEITDPVTIHLDLPLGSDEDERITWTISLETLVDDVIELHQAGDTGKVDDAEGQEICRAIAGRLRALADKLENACNIETYKKQ